MASAKALLWIDRLAWTALYAGLFAVVLGIVSGEVHVVAGWSLGVVGAVLAATGVILIIVRSRLSERPAAGAQSSPASQGKE